MPLFLAATLIMVVSIHHLQSIEKRNSAIYSNEEEKRDFCFMEKNVKIWRG